MLFLLAAVAIAVVDVAVVVVVLISISTLHFIIQFPQINVQFDVQNSKLIFIVCLQFVNCVCIFVIDPKRITSKQCIYFEKVFRCHTFPRMPIYNRIKDMRQLSRKRAKKFRSFFGLFHFNLFVIGVWREQ